jgi:hypothetical protein
MFAIALKSCIYSSLRFLVAPLSTTWIRWLSIFVFDWPHSPDAP